jgi:hypothetical protein
MVVGKVVEPLPFSNVSRLQACAMREKTVGIVTIEDFQRRKNIGSTRIRARWLLNYWPEAEMFTTGRRYEVVIFQKAYWLQYAEAFNGIKILDLCDPDFLTWRRELKRMIDCCDAVTASTQALVDVLKEYTSRPVFCVPDRLDPQAFEGMWKDHTGRGPAKAVAWYGYSHNFPALNSIVDALPEFGIEELLVVADANQPYHLPPALAGKLSVRNFTWGPDTVNENLLKADIVINPRILTGRWKYKSNNKTLGAWAIGLPVAHTREELAALIPEDARAREVKLRRTRLFDEYHVRKSVEEYRRLIDALELRAPHASAPGSRLGEYVPLLRAERVAV